LPITFPNNAALQGSVKAAYPTRAGQTAYEVISEIDAEYAFTCVNHYTFNATPHLTPSFALTPVRNTLYAAIPASAGYPTWCYNFAPEFPQHPRLS